MPESLQTLIRGSNKRAKDRQRYRPSNQNKTKGEPLKTELKTSTSKVAFEKPIKRQQLKNRKVTMAIARNPAKVAQLKRQMALKVRDNSLSSICLCV